jgi:metal-sulfur cluster biosynthetic enzyme
MRRSWKLRGRLLEGDSRKLWKHLIICTSKWCLGAYFLSGSEDLVSAIMDKLKEVIDPEAGLSIVDMGLIKDVSVISEGKVKIKMSLTVPSFMCPLSRYLILSVKKAAESVPGVKEAEIEIIEPY